MSDGEQIGRCWRQVYECGGAPSQLRIADALDRLAADVAAIKEAVCDGSVAAAIRERDEARAEAERFKAIVHSDAGHMARILIENERLRAAPAAPQPAAPPAGWLTEREQHALRHILAADVEPAIRSILSRAGSPPVVEVPRE